MLTSHHYLLSGFVAVSCAFGTFSHNVAISDNWLTVSPESALIESVDVEAVDVSHRGSGRIGETPIVHDHEGDKGPLASHRGSGRIQAHHSL